MHTTRRWAALLAAPALALVVAAGCGDDDDAMADIDMIEIRDALEDKVRDEIALTLYENAGSRENLVEQANDPESPLYEPDVYERITEDDEVTLDEFRELQGVANAVLHHSDNVIEDFQDRAVDAAGGAPEPGG
jgi:hypothetical protein